MKEITKIEPTITNGEVEKITVFYSEGEPQVFVPETVTITDAEVIPETVTSIEEVPVVTPQEVVVEPTE